jgi:hypothetical protein
MPITIRKFKAGSAEIEADAIYSYHIGNDQIGSEHLANNAVSYAAQIKDNIIGYAELTTGLQGSLAAGSVPAANSIGTTQLKDPSVDLAELYDNAVGSSSKIGADVIMGYHIVDDAIGSEHLEANAVGSSNQVGDNVIHDEHIADDAIGSSADIAADVVMGYHIVDDAIGSEHLEANAVGSSAQVGDNTIGHDQLIDGAVGYTELTTGLQGSLGGRKERPYAGDYSEVNILGTTPGTVKTAAILKNAYALPLGSIKIAAQLKCTAGTYDMEVLLGTVHKLSFTGTLTTYKTHIGSFGVSGEADGVLDLTFTIKNSQGTAHTYNKLVDIIAVI